MSQIVYPGAPGASPVLPGLTWSVGKTPNWGTRVQRSVSGRRLATSDYLNPIWTFTLIYNFLHDTPFRGVNSALRTLMDFFNSRAGAFDTFLLDDPTDDTALGQLVIPQPTDQTGRVFQLTRALIPGGFNEWMTAPRNVTAVYFNGSLQSPSTYSVDALTGLVGFNTAVGGGITVTADFTYWFRVYFEDALDFENFAYQLWELKKVKLTSVVL